jgi:hypothetical protein
MTSSLFIQWCMNSRDNVILQRGKVSHVRVRKLYVYSRNTWWINSQIYTKHDVPYFKIIKLGWSQNEIILHKLTYCWLICTYHTINVLHTEISVFNVKKIYLHTFLLLCSIRRGRMTGATHALKTICAKLIAWINEYFFTIHGNQ